MKPPISPTLEYKFAEPEGGLTKSRTEVSSMPAAMTEILKVDPESQFFKLFDPHKVAPVPHMMRLELKGSISRASIIHPSFIDGTGETAVGSVNQGDAESSMEYRKLLLG
jgi:hypothetical protein